MSKTSIKELSEMDKQVAAESDAYAAGYQAGANHAHELEQQLRQLHDSMVEYLRADYPELYIIGVQNQLTSARALLEKVREK